jgi:plastocyanin
MMRRLHFCWLSVFLLGGGLAFAQGVNLTGRVALMDGIKKKDLPSSGNVVFWLTPAGSNGVSTLSHSTPLRLTQRNKSFEPHVLVVPVGSVVEFPNRDPFFHNVFSLFEGKKFDLGLYEAGSTRDVHFDKPGISYIFCNIHAQMSAVVIALETPYYGVSDRRGQIEIPHVPPGRYVLRAWYETALPDALNDLTREVTVSENSSTLGVFRLAAASLPLAHKNKYGKDYDVAVPDSTIYEQH